jgi:hypothetical protein
LSTDSIRKATNTHAALAMASESILPGKSSVAGTLVRLVTGVDLGVTLQIMLSDKTLAASIAPELSITQMCLDMGANVFSPTESLVTSRKEAGPPTVYDVLVADETLDIFWCNTGVLYASVNL